MVERPHVIRLKFSNNDMELLNRLMERTGLSVRDVVGSSLRDLARSVNIPIPVNDKIPLYTYRSDDIGDIKRADEDDEEALANCRGLVYLYATQYGVKIGCSSNLPKRISQLRNNLPCEGDLIYSVEVENRHSAEYYLHRLFAHKRIRSEWFDLKRDDIDFIKCIDFSKLDLPVRFAHIRNAGKQAK